MERLADRPLDPIHRHIKQRLGNLCKALAVTNGDASAAADYAERQAWLNGHEVSRLLKGGVAALGPDDALGLAGAAQGGFNLSPALRPATILGRIPGVRSVPFDVRLINEVTGVTANFVGPGEPAPVSRSLYRASLMHRKKIMSLSVITKELAKTSDPAAQRTIEDDSFRAAAMAEDAALVSLTGSLTDDRPESIVYSAPQYSSGGNSVAAIDADLAMLIETLVSNGSTLEFAAWIMSPMTATHLAMTRGTAGAPAYPDISAAGGTLLGLPVITSAGVARSGSPTSTSILLVDGAHIAAADSGEASIDASQYAAIEMMDNPTNQAFGSPIETIHTTMVSMFQTESIAIRLTRFVNFQVMKTGAVAALINVQY